MNDDLLKQIRQDLEYLLSFVPARCREDVDKGLAPMFYVTGTYEGDIALADRVKEICERYNIEENDDDEDFVDLID